MCMSVCVADCVSVSVVSNDNSRHHLRFERTNVPSFHRKKRSCWSVGEEEKVASLFCVCVCVSVCLPICLYVCVRSTTAML